MSSEKCRECGRFISADEIVCNACADKDKGASKMSDKYSKCIQCGESYDKYKTSKEDSRSCSIYAIENYCPKCRPKLTLSQKVVGYTYIAGGITWIAARELALKPTVRKARKLFKNLSDWADK